MILTRTMMNFWGEEMRKALVIFDELRIFRRRVVGGSQGSHTGQRIGTSFPPMKSGANQADQGPIWVGVLKKCTS